MTLSGNGPGEPEPEPSAIPLRPAPSYRLHTEARRSVVMQPSSSATRPQFRAPRVVLRVSRFARRPLGSRSGFSAARPASHNLDALSRTKMVRRPPNRPPNGFCDRRRGPGQMVTRSTSAGPARDASSNGQRRLEGKHKTERAP